MALENQVTFAEVGTPKRVTQLTENTDASGAYFLTEKVGESEAKKTSYATVESAVKAKVRGEYLQILSAVPDASKTMSEKLTVEELKKRDAKIVQLEQKQVSYGGDSCVFITDEKGADKISDYTFSFNKANKSIFNACRIGVKSLSDIAGKNANLSIESNFRIPKDTGFFYSLSDGVDKLAAADWIKETVSQDGVYFYDLDFTLHDNFTSIFVQFVSAYWTDETKDLRIKINPEKSSIYKSAPVFETLGKCKDIIRYRVDTANSKPAMTKNISNLFVNKGLGNSSLIGGEDYSWYCVGGALQSNAVFGVKNKGFYINGELSIASTRSIVDNTKLEFYATSSFGEEVIVTPTQHIDEITGEYIATVTTKLPELYFRIKKGAQDYFSFRILENSGYWVIGDHIIENIQNRAFNYDIPKGEGVTKINETTSRVDVVPVAFRIGLSQKTVSPSAYLKVVSKSKLNNKAGYTTKNGAITLATVHETNEGSYFVYELYAGECDSLFIQCENPNGQPFDYNTVLEIDRASHMEKVEKGVINEGVDKASNVYDYLVGNTVAYKQVKVKKDGTGDFVDINSAINSIIDASATNQYEVLIYDDWYWNNWETDFQAFNNTSIFVTKDYVHLRGMNGTRTLFCDLPNDIPAYWIANKQVCWWHGNCNITNINFKIKNGRYAVHTDNGAYGEISTYKKAYNCIFNHLGNQDAVNFDSWKSDAAWGIGSSDGTKYYFENCEFIARDYTITSHTNHDFSHPNIFSFKACKITSRECTYAVHITNLGSQDNAFMEFWNCSIFGGVAFPGELGGDNLIIQNENRNVFTQNWKVFGGGNTDFWYAFEILHPLRITCALNKSIKNISGTAKELIFRNTHLNRHGISDLKGCVVGDVDLLYNYATPFGNAYQCSMGYRLGDCSVNNKTLIVTLSDNTAITVTFDKNYAGGNNTNVAPAYSNTQILAEMNAVGEASGIEFFDSLGGEFEQFANFSDKQIVGYNSSTNVSLKQGDCIELDEFNRFKLATNRVDGILTRDLPYFGATLIPNDSTYAVTNKLFSTISNFSPITGNPAKGTKYRLENGKLVADANTQTPAAIVIVDNMPVWERQKPYFGHTNFSIIKLLL